ncbi:MAG: hypothetical protein AAGF07_03330 [Patescibacteria group bacterium]
MVYKRRRIRKSVEQLSIDSHTGTIQYIADYISISKYKPSSQQTAWLELVESVFDSRKESNNLETLQILTQLAEDSFFDWYES